MISDYLTCYFTGFAVVCSYAQACYTYGYYRECTNICTKFRSLYLEEKLGPKHNDLSELDLLYGKAMYYCCQPELRYLAVQEELLTQEELALVSNECISKLKICVSLLGKSLDKETIDEEGSEFLDYALMACAAEFDCLDQCNRCLLCRRGGQKLKKSHIWPNAVLKRIYKADYEGTSKPFLFGKQRNKPKNFKECTIHMFCLTCEGLLSQNGEEQFAKLLDSDQGRPHSTQMTYGKWMYDFAVGMAFRLFTSESISYFVNHQEMYNLFLLCRKHLFTLTVKIDATVCPPFSEVCGYQFNKLLINTFGEMCVYMMHCHAKHAPSQDPMIKYFSEFTHCSGSVATCQLSDAKLDPSGRIHFLEIYCNGFHFLVKFQASERCAIPNKFLIDRNAECCSVPLEDPSSIPDGVWSVLRHLGVISFKSRMQTYQEMSDTTIQMVSSASPYLSAKSNNSTDVLEILETTISGSAAASSMGPIIPPTNYFSFLPKEYVVRKDVTPVQLPEGHRIVIHLTGQSDDLLMTYFLCTNGSDYYIIIVHCDGKSGMQITEGVYISTDEVPVVTKFLIDNRPGLEDLPHPFTIDELQMIINQQFPSWLLSKGIKCLPQLKHLVDCRR